MSNKLTFGRNMSRTSKDPPEAPGPQPHLVRMHRKGGGKALQPFLQLADAAWVGCSPLNHAPPGAEPCQRT